MGGLTPYEPLPDCIPPPIGVPWGWVGEYTWERLVHNEEHAEHHQHLADGWPLGQPKGATLAECEISHPAWHSAWHLYWY